MRKEDLKLFLNIKIKISIYRSATHHAAGYDFEAAEEVVIPSIWKAGWKKGLETVADGLKKMYQKMKNN